MAVYDGVDLINIEELMFPEPVSAGMNPFVLMSLAYLMRSTNEDVEPIIVQRESLSVYRIVDGRHRAVAAMMAGRKYIAATHKEA